MQLFKNKTIAVLGYHKIGDPPPGGWYTWSYVPTDVFEMQLQYLKENDWEALLFEQFLSALSCPASFPEKSILITFDDGYRSNFEIALPILKKYNYPAVMFVPTSFIGSYNAFDADIFYEPKENICSWEELIELERSGVSIQSHSVNHPHFSDISSEEMKTELIASKEILQQQLNKKIEAFAFPYGDNGSDADETDLLLAQSGYKAAFLYGGGPVQINTIQPFRISRIPVGPDTELKKELEKAM